MKNKNLLLFVLFLAIPCAQSLRAYDSFDLIVGGIMTASLGTGGLFGYLTAYKRINTPNKQRAHALLSKLHENQQQEVMLASQLKALPIWELENMTQHNDLTWLIPQKKIVEKAQQDFDTEFRKLVNIFSTQNEQTKNFPEIVNYVNNYLTWSFDVYWKNNLIDALLPHSVSLQQRKKVLDDAQKKLSDDQAQEQEFFKKIQTNLEHKQMQEREFLHPQQKKTNNNGNQVIQPLTDVQKRLALYFAVASPDQFETKLSELPGSTLTSIDCPAFYNEYKTSRYQTAQQTFDQTKSEKKKLLNNDLDKNCITTMNPTAIKLKQECDAASARYHKNSKGKYAFRFLTRVKLAQKELRNTLWPQCIEQKNELLNAKIENSNKVQAFSTSVKKIKTKIIETETAERSEFEKEFVLPKMPYLSWEQETYKQIEQLTSEKIKNCTSNDLDRQRHVVTSLHEFATPTNLQGHIWQATEKKLMDKLHEFCYSKIDQVKLDLFEGKTISCPQIATFMLTLQKYKESPCDATKAEVNTQLNLVFPSLEQDKEELKKAIADNPMVVTKIIEEAKQLINQEIQAQHNIFNGAPR
jgi:hypothetical protein